MKRPNEIIAAVLEPGIIGEHPGGPLMVATDIIEHLEAAGYEISQGVREMRDRCASEAFRAITAVCITDDGNTFLADHVASAIRALPESAQPQSHDEPASPGIRS